MKSIIFKLICDFSKGDGMEIYSEDSINALITYLVSLSNVERNKMATQFKTETNKIHSLIIPKADPHKKCKEKIIALEKENAELRKEILELKNENAQLKNEISELKLMFMEHLKVCKMQ